MISVIYTEMNFESFFLFGSIMPKDEHQKRVLNWMGAGISNRELLETTMLEF